MIGDALNLPVIKASANFAGMAVIDADPYTNTGVNWYTNTNNFFRSIRNFVIDLTAMPQSSGAGIHWQVAQASSLQNIRFEMVKGGGDANQQQGIFMDNGSGGFMTDLVFNGGNYGMFLGNQQFTTRNVTFNDCNTAIFMNWDWAWTFKSVTVNNCAVGLNMSNSPTNQTVGSVLLLDSKISATSKGIITAFTNNSAPIGAGTLVLKNVDFTGSSVAVAGIGGNTILPGGSVVPSFVQGNTYTPAGGAVKRSSVSAGVLAPRQADVCAEGQMTTITIVTTLGVPTVRVPEAPIPAVSASTGSNPVISVSELVSVSAGPTPTQTTAASLSVSPSTAMTSSSAPVRISVPVSVPASSSVAVPSPSPSSRVPASSNGTSCANPSPVKARTQGPQSSQAIPSVLVNGNGAIFERSKPLYEGVAASSFVSVKAAGAKGDGSTDDTAAIQKVLNNATADQIVYFDHGAYIITSTIKVPKNIKIVGEIWPLLMASGTAFSDEKNPIPMLQIGQPGDKGTVEISDILLETKGPVPGAILMEWNVAGSTQGSAGMWDVHFRVGGSAGTDLQSDKCAKDPNTIHANPNPQCIGAFMMFHITDQGSAYVENSWFWVSDHELDLPDHSQIDIFNGRGVLIESKGPVWMYGTSSEHSQLYNYQVANAQNVFMALIQTETP